MSEKIVEISEDSLMWIDERYNRLREENKQLHSIIKEVREYPDNAKDNYIINKHQYVNFDNIREILDKGSDKE